jgi:hypothetical protein
MSSGLHPGATLPDFALPDETGAVWRLSEIRAAIRCSCSSGAVSTARGSVSTSGR